VIKSGNSYDGMRACITDALIYSAQAAEGLDLGAWKRLFDLPAEPAIT